MNEAEIKELLRYVSDMVDYSRGVVTLTLSHNQAEFIKQAIEIAGEL